MRTASVEGWEGLVGGMIDQIALPSATAGFCGSLATPINIAARELIGRAGLRRGSRGRRGRLDGVGRMGGRDRDGGHGHGGDRRFGRRRGCEAELAAGDGAGVGDVAGGGSD